MFCGGAFYVVGSTVKLENDHFRHSVFDIQLGAHIASETSVPIMLKATVHYVNCQGARYPRYRRSMLIAPKGRARPALSRRLR